MKLLQAEESCTKSVTSQATCQIKDLSTQWRYKAGLTMAKIGMSQTSTTHTKRSCIDSQRYRISCCLT